MKRTELKECVEFLGQDGSLDSQQRWALWTELRPVSVPVIGEMQNEGIIWPKLKDTFPFTCNALSNQDMYGVYHFLLYIFNNKANVANN